jgi:glycosyltransferase involved in cell wall biosynthesis
MTVSLPTLLITNRHQDYTGGGNYVMLILNILKKYYKIYVDSNVNYYTNPQTPWFMNSDEVHLYQKNIDIDLHLYADYNGWTAPLGKRNVQIVYYPLNKKVLGWNKFFVLNKFCLTAIQNLYTGQAHIITPYIKQDNFYISQKKNQLINIGHYFIEADGHSKNQHYVIEWFKQQDQFDSLILHGKLTHTDYYHLLEDLIDDDGRIKLKFNRPQNEIAFDLSESKALIHAMGYGRTNPAQTEHFGLVAVEALLSGCQPIVHNSGGCKDIPGVIKFDEFTDISSISCDPIKLRLLGEQFNEKLTEQQLLEALNE